MTGTAEVEAILAALPETQRAALQHLRETVLALVPDAEETISYSMPAVRYRGRVLVSYTGFKTHCSLFPMGSEVIDRHAALLAPFRTAKGTLQFTPERPIPDDVVELIVRERMAQVDARKRG